MSKLNVLQQLEKFEAGEYDTNAFEVQVEAGWYDWFCNTDSLGKKTQVNYKKVRQLLKTKKIQKLNLEEVYVWFKNNCPMSGKLYDDIRFSDIKTGENIFVIPAKGCGHNETPKEEKFYVWSGSDIFKGPTWRSLINFMNT